MALLVTTDFPIPLCHHTYPGNQTDGPTFAGLTAELIQRHQVLATQVKDITLVFDKGNNSRDNLQAVDRSPYHFIGSLVPSQHPELLALPVKGFHSLAADGLPGVSTYRTTKMVFGTQRVVVVTYNQKHFVAQSRTLLREIAKRQRLLGELQARLPRWQTGQVKGGKPPTLAGTRKRVQGWLAGRDLNELFEVDITLVKELPGLSYRFREEAWQQLQATRLGKTILFTDRDDGTDAEVVRGYGTNTMGKPRFATSRMSNTCRCVRNGIGPTRRSGSTSSPACWRCCCAACCGENWIAWESAARCPSCWRNWARSARSASSIRLRSRERDRRSRSR